ncbi:MAG: prepilin-type N-terminal cleavage/methylation domain-containing protein [Patescibacteria group bacterium]
MISRDLKTKQFKNDQREIRVINRRADRRFKGFTLIEVILVIAMLAVVASMSTAVYFGYYQGVRLDETRQDISNNAVLTRSKAMQGEEGLKWGIRFNNVLNDASDKYEIFATASDYSAGTIKEILYLSANVEFSDPANGATKDVIFNKISGTAGSAAGVSIILSGTPDSRTININAQGLVY